VKVTLSRLADEPTARKDYSGGWTRDGYAEEICRKKITQIR
jgi:hypothetical protein